MKSLFTIHAGEYLVGAHLEHKYPKWNIWFPSKDTGIDLLVTNGANTKAVSLQVKFSKDFNPTHGSPIEQNHLLAAGWWKHDIDKIKDSQADFWVFVLPSFVEKQTSFIILAPTELAQRFRAIHGASKKVVHSYLRVTNNKIPKCWEARGLGRADLELIAHDRYFDRSRDFSKFLNAWGPIEKTLK